jgi:hypothetical protein
MELLVIYKISPDPSLPKRERKWKSLPKKGEAERQKIPTRLYEDFIISLRGDDDDVRCGDLWGGDGSALSSQLPEAGTDSKP